MLDQTRKSTEGSNEWCATYYSIVTHSTVKILSVILYRSKPFTSDSLEIFVKYFGG